MRPLGLQCLMRRRKRYNSFRGEVGEAAENVLNRQFAAETAHTKWATDVTEFNIGSSKVYLSPILDLHDNRIISVTAGPSPSVKMVTDSLRMAIDTLNACEKPLVHSDSETVCAGVFRFPGGRSNGDVRMLVPGVPSVPDPHSDRRTCVFPWICRFLGTPGEALRLTVGVTRGEPAPPGAHHWGYRPARSARGSLSAGSVDARRHLAHRSTERRKRHDKDA